MPAIHRRRKYSSRRPASDAASTFVRNFRAGERRSKFDRELNQLVKTASDNAQSINANSAMLRGLPNRRMGSGLYSGRGGYWGKKIGGMAGGFLGGRLGMGALGSKIGGFLGDKGSDYMSKLLSKRMGGGLYSGRGEYHTNNLVEGSEATVPQMIGHGDETGAVSICHKEYLSDVYAPGVAGGPAINFQNTSYPLNPALQGSFPFLSQLAQNYDEYEFIQLLYHYRSTTTDIGNSTTGQCGTVILCTNYNSAALPFSDKQQMLEYAHAHDCKLTEHMTHGVECDPSKKALGGALYTRSNPVINNQDIKTYDAGLFQLAIANCPAGYNGFPIGELWVEYNVVLRKPKLFASRGLDIDSDVFVTPSVAAPGAPVAKGSSPFGFSTGSTSQNQAGSIYVGQQNNIGCLVLPSTIGDNLKITFPAAFTGSVEINLIISPLQVVAGLSNVYCSGATFAGNIVGLYDLYDGNASINPTYVLPGMPLTVGTILSQGSTHFFTTHVMVRASTTGIDNTVTLFFNQGVTSNVQSNLSISSYQSNGVVDSTRRLQWVNSSSGIVVPSP